ncbi:hypothetical protein [uncultured Porphyromonas sp.]|uniref:hypothetical protein n=1 Tax=uncultured Porphyromonas sp. TaxID=159274 RepID=UPI0026222321|nr:hypothetical protein [uncultured Porphyromonas sp.]
MTLQRQPKGPQELRLWLAILLVTCGMALLYMGFWVSPRGEIHSSVLVAYGEVMTFVGALIGIDYAARERFSDRGTFSDESDRSDESDGSDGSL